MTHVAIATNWTNMIQSTRLAATKCEAARRLVVFQRKFAVEQMKHARHSSTSKDDRGEGKGAPFLHAFNKAYPLAPPKVHVKGEEGIYVIDEAGNK
jgi:hypothetical protein